MDRLYSISLIVAFAAGSFSLAAGLFRILQAGATQLTAYPRWRNLLSCRVAAVAIALGGVSLALSIAVHSRWGHGPTSAQPLNFWGLINEHETFVAAAIILALGLAANIYGER